MRRTAHSQPKDMSAQLRFWSRALVMPAMFRMVGYAVFGRDRQRTPGRMTSTREPISPAVGATPQLEQRYAPGIGTVTGDDPGHQSSATGAATFLTWKAVAYVLVVGAACLFLVPLTNLWWIVPLLAAVAPLALLVVARRENQTARSRQKQAELLAAVASHGVLTPLDAAHVTTCTAIEAARLMDTLASEGALVRLPDGGPTRVPFPRAAPGANWPRGEPAPATHGSIPEHDGFAPLPEESLSDREREVLELLAAGRTNAEVAHDLFISIGTVKSHSANIYRKLGAKNRTEAISRARRSGILR